MNERILVSYFLPYLSRRSRFLPLLVAFVASLLLDSARAEDAVLPVGIQVELLVKVASYDRNFQQRAGDKARIFILSRPGNGASSRMAAQVEAALARAGEIGGLPHAETVMVYHGAGELAAACRAQHAAVIFFGAGFADELRAIRDALDGVDVLSVSAIPEYVEGGIVLGFDVASGRPQLLVNLGQAKKQKVALRSDVLKLMKVFQ